MADALLNPPADLSASRRMIDMVKGQIAPKRDALLRSEMERDSYLKTHAVFTAMSAVLEEMERIYASEAQK